MLKEKIREQTDILIAQVEEIHKIVRWITRELDAAKVKYCTIWSGEVVTLVLTGLSHNIDIELNKVRFDGETYQVTKQEHLDIFFDRLARLVVVSLNQQGGQK